MTDLEKQQILARARAFFRDNIAENHLANTLKLHDFSKLNVNPFTVKHITCRAGFLVSSYRR